MNLVSIIILNWNGRHFLDDCLLSLKKQTYDNFEVIIVDNGSTDGSVSYIKDKYSDFVLLIENPVNLGFAAGNNIGIKASAGKYIILLNNDTKVEPDFINQMAIAAQKDDKVGMCAAKIYLDCDGKYLDTAGHLIYRDGLNRGRGRLEQDHGQFEDLEEVFFPSGSAALYKRDMLEETGLFDEDFFAYGDDTDLGIKCRLFGWKCLYVPGAVVWHKLSGSSAVYSPDKILLVERNRIWVALKYFPAGLLFLNPYYTFIRYSYQLYNLFLQEGAAGRFVKQHSHASLFFVLLRANIQAIMKFSKMLAKRKKIQKNIKVSTEEIYNWFDLYGISARELSAELTPISASENNKT
jgi:GT2 family glycosyltransferase